MDGIYNTSGRNEKLMMMLTMISGATAQTGPWPPFTGFMIVFIVRCGVISSTIDQFQTP
jgi:hypothetical protein